MKYSCVFLVILAATFSRYADALECYVCRGTGCLQVSEDQIQTCPPPPTPTEVPELPTDHDMDFDQSIDQVQIVDAPLLNEEDAEVKSSGFVLDKSELPGEKFFARGLKQYREDDDGARCIAVVYHEANGDLNGVRDCAYASDDETAACREAVGGNFAGDLEYCHLCDEDLCNSGTRAALALVTLVAGLLATL